MLFSVDVLATGVEHGQLSLTGIDRDKERTRKENELDQYIATLCRDHRFQCASMTVDMGRYNLPDPDTFAPVTCQNPKGSNLKNPKSSKLDGKGGRLIPRCDLTQKQGQDVSSASH